MPLSRNPRIYHVSTKDDFPFNLANFSQSPTPPEQQAESSPPRHQCHNLTCCHLVSPAPMTRALWDPVNNAAHLPVLMWEGQPLRSHFLTEEWVDVSSSFQEHFSTAPVYDDIRTEEQIPGRCLHIHERPDKPNHQCSYPCPYDSNTTFQMDLLQSMPQNEAMCNYDLLDFSDISSDLPDIMTTTSDFDIADLDDVSNAVWFT